VRGLRLSLNTPVVATEDLPIGPARAAILVHEDSARGETVTIGIRSLRADRVALYGLDPEAGDGTSLDVALDAALSFAESMGFLFDEDELGSGGAAERRRCHGLWRELLGDDVPTAAGRRSAPEREEPEELLLDELAEDATEVVAPDQAELELDEDEALAAGAFDPEPPEPEPLDRSDADVVAQVARAAAGGARRQAPLALTKFRGGTPKTAPAARSAAAAAEARPRRAKPLAKLRLVRRIRDGVRRRNPLLRLFGAF
jgi:hypothetical protein